MPSTILRLLSVAIIALGCCTAAAAAPVKLRAGVAVNFEGMLPVLVAQERGYLKDENIEIEKIDFQGGGPTVQAFAGGSIDLCFCAADQAMRLRSRGIPAVVLYGMDDLHDYTLIAKKGIPTAGGLGAMKGKMLGVTAPGGMTDNTLRWAIAKLKMKPESDFQLVAAGTSSNMVAAIIAGKVDAGMVVVTDREYLLKQGYEIVEDYTKVPYASFSTLALESWIKANPETARGLIRALEKAMADLRADPSVGHKAVKALYPNFSDDLIEIATKSAIDRVPPKGEYGAEAIKNLNEIMIGSDASLKPVTVDSLKPKL
jgi:NitT/TauT family transport system substrate-binding protein